MNLWPLLLIPLCGCTSLIRELKKPPFPCIATHHTRVLGIQASYNGYGLRLGFCSDTITLIPCSTNGLVAPAFSDRLKIGQSGFDTTIVEQVDAGFRGDPPPLMHQLFSPKNPPAHATAFAQKQALAASEHPRAASVGALDSFAPVFALQFNDTDRRPIAVLELNADDALNTYSVVGTISYSTNQPPALPK